MNKLQLLLEQSTHVLVQEITLPIIKEMPKYR